MEKEDKRRKRNNLIMGSILVFLMILSIGGYGLSQNNSQNNQFEYNNYKFEARNVQGGVLFFTTINGLEIGFYNDPTTAQGVVDNYSVAQTLSFAQTIVFSKEPVRVDGNISYNRVYYDAMIADLQQFSGKTIISALTEEEEFNPNIVYTCKDATPETPVIILGNGPYDVNTPEIEQVDYNCYEVKADMYQVFMVRDYLLYNFLGVFQ